jgi:hypothetical protein
VYSFAEAVMNWFIVMQVSIYGLRDKARVLGKRFTWKKDTLRKKLGRNSWSCLEKITSGRGEEMKRAVWLMVTHDKYELPIAVADTALELSMIVGCSENNIHASRSHSKTKGVWTPYRRVEIDDDDEQTDSSSV